MYLTDLSWRKRFENLYPSSTGVTAPSDGKSVLTLSGVTFAMSEGQYYCTAGYDEKESGTKTTFTGANSVLYVRGTNAVTIAT